MVFEVIEGGGKRHTGKQNKSVVTFTDGETWWQYIKVLGPTGILLFATVRILNTV